LEVKRKLIGSIFTEKLVFENGSYRTSKVNEAIELMGQFQKELGKENAGSFFPTEKMSGYVPMTGLEPALCCQK
jgi:site-specific DNA recombinase